MPKKKKSKTVEIASILTTPVVNAVVVSFVGFFMSKTLKAYTESKEKKS
jgi:hypothetical protein